MPIQEKNYDPALKYGADTKDVGSSGTATVSGGSANIDAQRGVVTTTSLTTGTSSVTTFDLVNDRIDSDSQILVTLGSGGNTGGIPVIGEVTTGASGSATIEIVNADGDDGSAFNGTLEVNFIVLS